MHCIRANNILESSSLSKPHPFAQFYLKKVGEKSSVKTRAIKDSTNPFWDEHLSLTASDKSDVLIVQLRNCDYPFDQLMDPLEFPLSSISSENPLDFDNDIKLNYKDAGHLEFHVCIDDETSNQLDSSTTFSIDTSLKEIDNILSSYVEDEFVFLMSNHKTVKCSKIIADLISPEIAKIHKCDPTANSFDLSFADYRLLEKLIRNKNNEYNVFKNKTINFDIGEFDSLIKIAEALGNIELYSQLTQKTELDVNNVVPILIHKMENKNSIESQTTEREIDFIAKNFSEISSYELMDLDYDTLSMIFSMNSFHINSEDDLFEFIYQLIDQDPESNYLLEFVQFEFLSPNQLKKYLSLIDFESMSSSVWKRICNRLLSIPPRLMIESSRKSKNIIHINFDHKDQFNGIFRYLNDQCKGNAHLSNLIEITSSGDKLNKCYEIIGKNWSNRWFTQNQHYNWWMVDFKEMTVAFTGYSLKTYYAAENDYPHLQSWIIEASNDKEHWDRIDKRDSNNYLKGPGFSKMFEFDRPTSPYRYFRLMSKGPDHANSNYLLLSNIEIFGTIYS